MPKTELQRATVLQKITHKTVNYRMTF